VMAGVAGICMGLMVEKLGSIFHVASSIVSAVGGPVTGLFFTGVCAPWVNAKGAVVGFVLSFIFSVWVVIGKFVRGGGSPPRLPLSTEGCPEDLALFLNATVTGLVNNTTRLADTMLTTTVLPDAVPANTTAVDGTQSNTIYEISYCYTGIIAVALTFIISSLISLLTGPNSPEDVSKGVVSPACARAYKRVWESVKGRPTYTVTQDIINEEEEAFKMLPRHNTDNLNTSS
ncbi:sodium-coupled monocarboxylate transporter 1-like, partial [Homarus americanus]|uniref:sodium-coupled monocarboxylate transporter 1-like n=1 Tax=Homarus americanus TaxID=6706 RepID=UPI001C485AEA